MPGPSVLSLLAALPATLLAVAGVFVGAYLVALRVGRHAVVDVAWGLGFVSVAVAVLASSSGAGEPTRRLLVLLLVTAWGLRLAAHIAWRSRGHGEDPRYAALLARHPGSPRWTAVRRIYLPQAAVLWFVSLPVQVAAFDPDGPGPLAWAGVAVWTLGISFETVGDWQLHRFRSDPENRGKVLDRGLWRYTRHPNYFGDACVWWGLWLLAADSLLGLLSVLSPVLMTWLLARGTGKPLLERDIAERRPDYADYVRRTSGFVPLPPRKTRKP